MAHDLLVEPLFSWRDRSRQRRRTTLPGLLARLASGELGDFPRLRTHQLHPWCMFLTQLAVLALKRADQTDPRLTEDEWKRLLLGLTHDRHEPWSLVVDDLSRPGFFQTPVPEGTVIGWKIWERPDDRDVLVTAKNHDVKTGLLRRDEPETWAYALTTLQTMQGYPGRGYNRISRMKGGYGSRPRVGITTDHSVGARFLRDIDVMLEQWSALLERGYRPTGVALTWLEPWNGSDSLPIDALAPHFIEVCWRVRCMAGARALRCLYTTTKARRCLPEVEGGDVGDAWIPVERADGTALTVGSGGFHYRLLSNVLFENEFAPAAAQVLRDRDGDPVLFVASALARGQGRTEGLHERVIPLKGKARPVMGQPDGRSALGRRAAARIQSVATLRSKILFPALKQLASGGDPMPDEIDARVDEIFFDHLFDTLELSDDDARLSFERMLVDLAKAELERAISRTGFAGSRKFKAISAAEGVLRAALRKHFSDVFGTQVTNEGGSA